MKRIIRLGLMAPSVVAYVACLGLDSFCVSGSCDGWPGWGVLALGGLTIFAGPANATWLANPLLFSAWGLYLGSRERAALACSLTALAIAASFMLQTEVLVAESGSLSTITGHAAGYWLWLAGMAAAAAAALAAMLHRRRATGAAAGFTRS